MNPLISVCIPSYNNSSFIAETIRSVLAQTYENFEIIIVDDCSTDNTVEIIKGFNDRRISLFENASNLGMHGNWNKSLSLAKGEFIKLLCGDDLIYPSCLELQLAAFQEPLNQNVSLVACKRKIITADGKEFFGSFYKLRPGKYTGSRAMKLCVSLGTNLIGEPMAVLLRASVFKQNHIVLASNNYMIDMDMYSKFLVGKELVMQNNVLAAFRIYGKSMSGSLGLQHAKYFNEFVAQKSLSNDFGVKWYHRTVGKFLEFNLNLARNLIFKLSR